MDSKDYCDIIEEFMREYYVLHNFREAPEVQDFIFKNNLGVPLAQGVAFHLCELTETGKMIVAETWLEFCELFKVDPTQTYGDFDDILMSTPED